MTSKTKKLAIQDIPIPPEDPDFDGPEMEDATPGEKGDPMAVAGSADFGSPDLPTANLDFTEDECTIVPIKGAFKQNGKTVSEFVCRPLTFGQVQDLARKIGQQDGLELVEIYALIAGTDVATFRGLREYDGQAVKEAARAFLPLVFRGDEESE